jgi:putative DNA primase/helicase
VKDATTDEATIRQWWQQWPDANSGIATGAVSGLVVLDVDPRHGGEESLQQLIDAHNGDFPETVTSLTGGGGGHFYFASPGVLVRNRVGLMPGLDIRGDGGYVVAPPSLHVSGQLYVWEPSAHPANTPIALLPPGLLTHIQAPTASPDMVQDVNSRPLIPEGQRHNTLLSLAGTMRRRGFSDEAIAAALLITNELYCVPPLDEAEVLSIVASSTQYPAGPSALVGDAPGAAYGLAPCTDLGNAERLVAQHGDDLLYCYPWRYWLVWNGSRWQRDVTGEIYRRAKDTVRYIRTEADQTTDSKLAQVLRVHAIHSESAQRLNAMVDLGRFHLPVLPDAFDQHPWLLNVANGTVDLRTGTFREARREDLLTRHAPVVYDCAATCPRWEAFLRRIMRDNLELMAFLKRAVGYTLTGDTREQVLFILYGTGANGKSTFLEVLRALLGDYARQSDFTTFLVRRSEGVRNDVARLAGARFVTAVEGDSGQRLDEALVKQLTGGDRVTARFFYKEFFEFVPECKLFLATNHKPEIRGTDHATWRRLRLIPCEVTIPAAEQDRTLVAALQAELPGILNWAIQGCLDWQREGLGEAEAIQQATAAYRADMDILADFLEACCVPDPDAFVLSRELYQVYEAWCAQNAVEPLKQTTLGKRLADRGFLGGAVGHNKDRIRRGLRLRTLSDKIADVRARMGAGGEESPTPTPGADGPPAIDPLASAPPPTTSPLPEMP